jgi:hypothetical protein
MKRLILVILLVFLSYSCTDENGADLCKNNSCEEWQECNSNTGLCNTKQDFCSNNGECTGLDVYCDEATHTCKIHDKCEEVICQDYEICNSVVGECELKDNACVEDTDCSGENMYCDNNECKKIPNPCDGVDCDNNGSCGVLEKDGVKYPYCQCDTGFINKQNIRCLEPTCANESPIGHTEEYATNPKGEPFYEKSGTPGHWFRNGIGLCPGAMDVYQFNDRYSLVKISSDYVVRFYENSISDENLVVYKINKDAEYGTRDYGVYQVENPEGKDIFMTIISDREDSVRYYDLDYIENCGVDDYCITDYSCNQLNQCVIECVGGNDCPSGLRCNETTNICENFTCTNDFECGVDYCINGNCMGFNCNANNDCDYMTQNDTENRNFECFAETCELIYDMNFGETKNIPLRGIIRIDTDDEFLNFDLTINNLDGIKYLYGATLFRYSSLFNEHDFFMNQIRIIDSPSTIKFKTNIMLNDIEYNSTINYLKISLDFLYCENGCENIYPQISLSLNNSIGCSSNEDCMVPDEAVKFPFCNTYFNSCFLLEDSIYSSFGEICGTTYDCNTPVVCSGSNCYESSANCINNKCTQIDCFEGYSGDIDICQDVIGEERYCFENKGAKYLACLPFCETDSDCPIIKKENIDGFYTITCNPTSHKCEYVEE